LKPDNSFYVFTTQNSLSFGVKRLKWGKIAETL